MGFYPWWSLSKKQKRALKQARLEGKFGGENAASVHRAPFIWQWESNEYGKAESGIKGEHFMRDAAAEFDQQGLILTDAYFRG